MRHGDSADRLKAGGVSAVTKVDPDDLAFVGFIGTRLHVDLVFPKCRYGELIMGFWIDGNMQIAAVGTKTRQNILIFVPIATSAEQNSCCRENVAHQIPMCSSQAWSLAARDQQ